ncbi:MAG: hypothetical protein ACPG5B_02630 [Chitinophagales bacterium]
MPFIPISIENFIQQEVAKNKNIDAKSLKQKLELALDSFWKGKKCDCGRDIWIIGSAFASANSCYVCFTGKKEPENEYEIAHFLHIFEEKNAA